MKKKTGKKTDYTSSIPIKNVLHALDFEVYSYEGPSYSKHFIKRSKRPTLIVNMDKNTFYDTERNIRGGLIKLMKILYSIEKTDVEVLLQRALKQIKPLYPNFISNPYYLAISYNKDSEPIRTIVQSNWNNDIPVRIELFQPIHSEKLIKYLNKWKINLNLADHFVLEGSFYAIRAFNWYYNIVMKNDSKGYTVFNSYFYGIVAPNDVSTFKSETPNVETLILFLYPLDFLAFITDAGTAKLPSDVIVLNSYRNLSKIVPRLKDYKNVICHLGNADTEISLFNELNAAYHNCKNVSQSDYPNYKGFSDYLKRRKKK